MSTAPERDENGRFVKADRNAGSPVTPGGEHPFSKVLFGWVENKRTPNLLLLAVSVLSVLLILLDFVLHRHDYISFAETGGFYAFWGFGAFALAVLAGWPLGHLLRRGEDYYGEADTRPFDTEAEE